MDRAPENQPTASIKVMLDNAADQLADWERHGQAAVRAFERASQQQKYWREQKEKLEYQYAIRLSEDEARGKPVPHPTADRGPAGPQGPRAPIMSQTHYSDQRER